MADTAQPGTFGATSDKGKGKAVDHVEDVSMGEDESDEDESNDDMDVSFPNSMLLRALSTLSMNPADR